MEIAFVLMAQAANNLCDCAQKHCFPTRLATVLIQFGLMRGSRSRLGLQTLVLSCFMLAACMLNSTANVRAVPYKPFVGCHASQRLIRCPRLDNQNDPVESTRTTLGIVKQASQLVGSIVGPEISNLLENPILQSDEDDLKKCKALVSSLQGLEKELKEIGDEEGAKKNQIARGRIGAVRCRCGEEEGQIQEEELGSKGMEQG